MFRNKKNIFLFLFTALFASHLFSQNMSAVPKWVKTEDVSAIKKVGSKNIKDGYYYVLASEQYNDVLKENFFHYATNLVSEAGLDFVSQIEVSYDPLYEKVHFHFIRIHRNGKIIEKNDLKSFKTLDQENERNKGILNGRKTLYRNLDDIRKGDIVEYAYSVTGRNPIFSNVIDHNFYFSYSVPIGKIFYRLITPSNVPLHLNNLHKDNFTPEKTENGNSTEYIWSFLNPPVIALEENVPGWYDPYAQTQISSLNSWSDVKAFCSALFVKPKTEIKLLNDLVKNVTDNFPNDIIAQASALVDFIQNEIRYSGNEQGIYSHTPHQADFVLKNRFGDCKDKSFLLCLALEKIGIKAYPTLLNTSLNEHITDYIPSVKKFDHCICAIQHNGAYVFIDPTVTLQKGPFMKRGLMGHGKCMVLDGKDTYFYSLPKDTESKIKFKEYFDINEETGDASLKTSSVYYGTHADYIRYLFASNSLDEIQESYKSYYSRYTDNIEVDDSIGTMDDTVNNIFTVKEFYVLKGFWKAKDNEKEITQNILPISVNERIRYAEEAIRKSPLRLYSPVDNQQEIIINKPGGWNVENSTVSENNKFFDYTYVTTVSGTELKLDYHYVNKVHEVFPDDYADYKEKTDFIDKNIVFSPIQSLVTTGDDSFNWILTVTLILFLAGSIFVCLFYYKKAFSYTHMQQYDSIGGWLVLVAIGICFTPVALLAQVVLLIKDDMFSNIYITMFDSASSNYSPMRAVFMLMINGGNVFLVVASVFLAILFFQRKNSFRPYYVFYKCFNVAFLIADLILMYYYLPDGGSESSEVDKEVRSVVRVFIQACIWVPYIWYSERSRHTFTVGNLVGDLQGDQPREAENKF